MTRDANWDTRWNVQKQHIVWRETFYEIKYNLVQKAYAHFRMMFVNKDSIIGASCTLADYCDKFGTVTKFREAIGDTKRPIPKKFPFSAFTDAKLMASWAIRAPLLVVALIGFILREGGQGLMDLVQVVCQKLPGSIE